MSVHEGREYYMRIWRFRVAHIIFLAPMKIQGGKTNEQKENRMAIRQTVEKAVIRDEQNRRIQFAATNPIKEVLKKLHTTLRGLEVDEVSVSRAKYGTNKVTHEKRNLWQNDWLAHLSIHLPPFYFVWL